METPATKRKYHATQLFSKHPSSTRQVLYPPPQRSFLNCALPIRLLARNSKHLFCGVFCFAPKSMAKPPSRQATTHPGSEWPRRDARSVYNPPAHPSGWSWRAGSCSALPVLIHQKPPCWPSRCPPRLRAKLFFLDVFSNSIFTHQNTAKIP